MLHTDCRSVQDDVSAADAQCRVCGAVYRITIVRLREGKHVDRSHLSTIDGKPATPRPDTPRPDTPTTPTTAGPDHAGDVAAGGAGAVASEQRKLAN